MGFLQQVSDWGACFSCEVITRTHSERDRRANQILRALRSLKRVGLHAVARRPGRGSVLPVAIRNGTGGQRGCISDVNSHCMAPMVRKQVYIGPDQERFL
jgi:hypothetical protein